MRICKTLSASMLLTLLLALALAPGLAFADDGIPMYRLYNPWSGEHFYTANIEECDNVHNAGWTYEGIGWVAPSTGDPVYRLYNSFAGDHHYTMSAEERDVLVAAGWNDEEIGWYSDPNEAMPLFREYNPNEPSCNHNYTSNEDEHNYLVGIGWRNEGKAWYGLNIQVEDAYALLLEERANARRHQIEQTAEDFLYYLYDTMGERGSAINAERKNIYPMGGFVSGTQSLQSGWPNTWMQEMVYLYATDENTVAYSLVYDSKMMTNPRQYGLTDEGTITFNADGKVVQWYPKGSPNGRLVG